MVRCSHSSLNRRTAFTILELLVTVAIIGITMALLLPAIGMAREAARRLQCTSHLQEIGVAIHNHHSAVRSMPAGWTYQPGSRFAYGWAVPLLPYIEQAAIASTVNTNRQLVDPFHDTARKTSIDLMLCPSDINDRFFTLYRSIENIADGAHTGNRVQTFVSSMTDPLVQLPTANYVGMFGTLESDDSVPAPLGDGPFIENRAVGFHEFARGLSNTIVIGERTMAQVPSTWLGVDLAGEDASARLVGSALEGINNPLADECDYSSRHPGGANFLWGDGHVSFVAEVVDLHLYHQWSRLRDY